MTDTTGMLSISDIVREYNVSHGQMYRFIRRGQISADAITREKYKGRQGWRSLINRNALSSLALTPRNVTGASVDTAALAAQVAPVAPTE
jgi:hypothetical protein